MSLFMTQNAKRCNKAGLTSCYSGYKRIEVFFNKKCYINSRTDYMGDMRGDEQI